MREATAGARGGAAAGETASEARFDVEAVREDFPILHRAVHDRRLIYLDSAATALILPELQELFTQISDVRPPGAERT